MEMLSGDDTSRPSKLLSSVQHSMESKIGHYHCDNGCFAEKKSMDACQLANQGVTFCAVGAHQQNGVAEKCIRDITKSARTMLLHTVHRWPQAVMCTYGP